MRNFESERFETQLGPFAYDRLRFAVQGEGIRGTYLSGNCSGAQYEGQDERSSNNSRNCRACGLSVDHCRNQKKTATEHPNAFWTSNHP